MHLQGSDCSVDVCVCLYIHVHSYVSITYKLHNVSLLFHAFFLHAFSIQFFNNTSYIIGGHCYSLNHIENGVLRGNKRPIAAIRRPFSSRHDPRYGFYKEHNYGQNHCILTVVHMHRYYSTIYINGTREELEVIRPWHCMWHIHGVKLSTIVL